MAVQWIGLSRVVSNTDQLLVIEDDSLLTHVINKSKISRVRHQINNQEGFVEGITQVSFNDGKDDLFIQVIRYLDDDNVNILTNVIKRLQSRLNLV